MPEQPVVPVEAVPDIVELDMGRLLITGIVLNCTGSRQSCNRGSYGLEPVLPAHRHALPVLAGTSTEVRDAPDCTLTIDLPSWEATTWTATGLPRETTHAESAETSYIAAGGTETTFSALASFQRYVTLMVFGAVSCPVSLWAPPVSEACPEAVGCWAARYSLLAPMAESRERQCCLLSDR